MKASSPSPADGRVRLIRPFLPFRRGEIELFARQERIKFRHDRTNECLGHDRNRLRRKLLPLVRQDFQPALDEVVLRVMDIVGAESDYIAEATHSLGMKASGAFDLLHVALQRRWLRLECFRHGITPDWRLIERLRLEADRPWMVGAGQVAWRDAEGRVRLERVAARKFRPRCQEVLLRGDTGEILFDEVRLIWRLAPWMGWAGLPSAAGVEHLDAEKVGTRLLLRHWRPGDRFQPLGMASPVKVQDLFTNLKIPKSLRTQLVMAERPGGGLLWIEGVRLSEQAKIEDGTKFCLELRWFRVESVAPARAKRGLP